MRPLPLIYLARQPFITMHPTTASDPAADSDSEPTSTPMATDDAATIEQSQHPEPVNTDPAEPEELPAETHVVLEIQPEASRRPAGIVAMGAFAAALLLFAAIAFLTQWLTSGSGKGSAPEPQKGLPVIHLQVEGKSLEARVATTPQQLQHGLMGVRRLGKNEGMLLDLAQLPQQGKSCIWTRHTPVELSVAFLDADQKIMQISHPEPESDALHCSAQPARFILEMPQGWFAANKVAVGSRVARIS